MKLAAQLGVLILAFGGLGLLYCALLYAGARALAHFDLLPRDWFD